MFFTEAARKRVDHEKGLFDFARMFVTVLAFIGMAAIAWTIWSLQNLELEIGQRTKYLPIIVPTAIKWTTCAIAIITSIFTLFLWLRTVILCRDVSISYVRDQRSIIAAFFALLLGILVLTMPMITVIVFMAIMEGIQLA